MHYIHTGIIVEESVLCSKHIRRPHDGGIREDLSHHLLSKSLRGGGEGGGGEEREGSRDREEWCG